MVRRSLTFVICALGLVSVLGCGDGGSKVQLAGAGGVVKYKGAPLAGASVTFIPESGPIATGTTDLTGTFTLSTGALNGATVGECKVAIAAVQGGGPSSTAPVMDTSRPPSSPEEGMKRMKQMQEAQKAGGTRGADSQPKSIIPEKYADAQKSGLKQTVDKDATKNQFVIELED